MQIPKDQILSLLRERGQDDKASAAEGQLPDTVDTDQHGDLVLGGPPSNAPACPCTGWGLPSRRVTATLVRSYRTISPLPVAGRPIGGVFLWHFPAGFPGSVA